MALIEKLTAIADSIRAKTGGTDPLTLDAMAEAIANIEAGGGGGGIGPTITVETVIATESGTTGDVVHNYLKTLFPNLDDVALCLFKALIVKDVETAKQTNNGLLGIYATYYASASPSVNQGMLRWRNGSYSVAQNGSGFDVLLASGTEFYMVTVDMEGLWA